MSEWERFAVIREARGRFDDALREMERFVMNLDPARAQALRDWLRSADADGRADAHPAPPLEGLPLADRIGDHAANVLAARAAWREARRPRRPAE